MKEPHGGFLLFYRQPNNSALSQDLKVVGNRINDIYAFNLLYFLKNSPQPTFVSDTIIYFENESQTD
jgi:hypothetical protein